MQLNEYLNPFHGYYTSNNMEDEQLNKILIHDIPDVWSNQANLQGYNVKL